MLPSRFDEDSTWSPERYSPDRAQQQALLENSVPLAELVSFRRETFNPAGSGARADATYVVLDTSHAYEGRLQLRGQSTSAVSVGSVKRPLKPGYVIVSRLRTYLRQVALVDDTLFQGCDGVLCSTEFYVLAPKGDADIAFLVPFLLSAPVQKAFSAAEEGGHHPRIPPDVLLKLAVPLGMVQQRGELSRRVRESTRLIREGEEVMLALHHETSKLNTSMSPKEHEAGVVAELPKRARRAHVA